MCCHCPHLYKKLLFLQASIGFVEFILMIVRVALFFSPGNRSGLLVGGFLIDWLTSFGPTLVGLFVVLVILVFLLKLCAFALNVHNRSQGRNNDINTSGILRKILRSKSIRRFIIVDCNCPCYKPRPQLRFRVRLTYLILCFILRIISIALYASARFTDQNGSALAIVCAVSLAFIFSTLALDLYRYCVWWHYTPSMDTRCHLRSEKHERYIPYHIIGNSRDRSSLGNEPCPNNPCSKTQLDHIAIFHSNEYQPQRRWRDVGHSQPLEIDNSKWPCAICKKKETQPHYIGFHTTTPESVVAIAHSNFLSSTKGWLGAGTYFARSVEGTAGKHRSTGGAWIIVEVRMGKVYEISRNLIDSSHASFNSKEYDFVHHTKWQEEYDTCYMIHDDERKDEFAIKDPERQIVKWVMVVDSEFDKKVERYELDKEFDTTRCYCI